MSITPEVPESGTPEVGSFTLPDPGTILPRVEFDPYAEPARERIALHLVVSSEVRRGTAADGTEVAEPRAQVVSLGYADECADFPLSAFGV